MGLKFQIFLVGSAILLGLYLTGFFTPAPPSLDPGTGWWAKEDQATAKKDISVRDFKITFSQEGQDDLKRRLQNTRYFESLEGTNWNYGIRADSMKIIVDHWLTNYSWPKQEKVFNQFNHFKTNIEGIDIHFLHVKPKVKPGQKVKPILMVHGWPGSFYEFYKVIPMLTDPTNHGGTEDDVFEVICPSLPGYGFSEEAHKPGMGPIQIARIFNTLMHERLGFDNYYVQGGDWGSTVVEFMSLFFPQYIRGHHNNFLMVTPPWMGLRLLVGHFFPEWSYPRIRDRKLFSPLGERLLVILRETGYFHIQATKPDTIGQALTDSPAGLAAYIFDKVSFPTNPDYINYPDGKLTERFELDDLLNNVMVHWIGGRFTASMRSYKEIIQLFPKLIPFLPFVRGHHNNFVTNVQPPFYIGRILVGSFFPSLVVPSERDQKRMFPFKDYVYTALRETGYMHIQATKPDTIGHGLTDSPAGLVAYILEKFSVWTNLGFPDCVDGCLMEKFELDDLLNNVMVYWISGSITSSMRLYKETFGIYDVITKYDIFVRGHHNNFLNVQPPFYIGRILVGSFFPSLVVTSERDQNRMLLFKDFLWIMLRETGYAHIQATKPDTIGHGLTDSPAGLAAYILEKFGTRISLHFSDSLGDCLLEKFELDDLLNDVMVYWISGSITSSMRLYKETFGNFYEITKYDILPNSVPLGYASFPLELLGTPENWLSYKFKNVLSYTEMPEGGHFAALEQPKLLAEDLRQFTRKVEEFLKKED